VCDTIQKLARFFSTEYDWRKVEARLNALPNFITNIDGLDIHFIHVRSKHENALPMIVTHGWPGSIIEQLKIIEPRPNPTAHRGSAADAFHLVIPSLPGYGFSGKPTEPGWNPVSIAPARLHPAQRCIVFRSRQASRCRPRRKPSSAAVSESSLARS
jgi:pimeloyl-ACP methyl ester carboxylesterase